MGPDIFYSEEGSLEMRLENVSLNPMHDNIMLLPVKTIVCLSPHIIIKYSVFLSFLSFCMFTVKS